MAITTYSELQDSVANWIDRSDLTSQIKDFIAIAESRWRDRLRANEMLVRTTLSVSDRYTSLPSGFLEVYSLYSASPYPKKLTVLSSEQIAVEREKTNDTPDHPAYYAIAGNEIEIYPTPSSATTLDIVYYDDVPALSDAAPTNWLLTKYPELYLFGALISSAPFLNDDDRFPLWVNTHDTRLEEINQAAKRTRFGGATPRQRFRPIG